MRVTQSMLSRSNLTYISDNYSKLGKLQDQINTGKKITKPSDDPVVAVRGMAYRTQLAEVEQFNRNLDEGFNWMDNAETALDETTSVLQRIRELTVQASNDTYNELSRQNISEEIDSLQEQLVALANTKIGDNYIFNGKDTASKPINESLFNVDFVNYDGSNPGDYVISYKGQTYEYEADSDAYVVKGELGDTSPATIKIDGTNITYTVLEDTTEVSDQLDPSDLVITNKAAVSTNSQMVEIEVMKGVTIPINTNSKKFFSTSMFGGLEAIKKMLTDPNSTGGEFTRSINTIDQLLANVTSSRAQLGAQVNRAEMIEDRLLKQKEIATQSISDNEDIEIEEAFVNLTTQQMIHQASLAVGAKIIQPSLMDYLR